MEYDIFVLYAAGTAPGLAEATVPMAAGGGSHDHEMAPASTPAVLTWTQMQLNAFPVL